MLSPPATVFDLQAEFCLVMAHPLRSKIAHFLQYNLERVKNIAETLQVNRPTVPWHLNILHEIGILVASRQGVDVFFRTANPKIVSICEMTCDVLTDRENELSKILVQFDKGRYAKG